MQTIQVMPFGVFHYTLKSQYYQQYLPTIQNFVIDIAFRLKYLSIEGHSITIQKLLNTINTAHDQYPDRYKISELFEQS